MWDHLREMGVDLMGFQGFRQGIHRDKRRSERLSLLHKQFCSVQTEGREHPTQRRTNAVIRTKGSHHRFQSARLGNPPGRAKWKSETESHKRGEAFPENSFHWYEDGTKRTIKPRGISRIPHRRESDGIEREEPPFQFRLTISIRTLRNNRSNTSPTEWFSPATHSHAGALRSILFCVSVGKREKDRKEISLLVKSIAR